MPQNKDLKRLVRARMKKTGEAYTAARAHITKKPSVKTASAVKSADYAAIAGMSDAVIKEKTGCNWALWVAALDYAHAAEMTHGERAALINTKWKVGGWYSQMVAVGYERIKGLRAKGQRLDGTYEASKSRTYNVPVKKLFDAWKDSKIRTRWLSEPGVKVRTATPPKTMRIGMSDGSIVAVSFMPKGESKSAVALAHTKLRSKEEVNRLKAVWTERLDALGEVVSN
jgi:hypothetical protein